MQTDLASGSPRRLRRNLSVWQAVGLSVALMAPSMAANINPQATAMSTGRAVPLAFLIAAIAVLLVGYGFVRLCQYFQHAGSVYAFVGLTLGPRTGVVSGLALFATYTFYGVVTSSASGILGSAFLDQTGIWSNPPTWVPFAIAAISLAGALLLTVTPARRGTSALLGIEGVTVAIIVIVTIVVLVRLIAGNPPNGGGQHFTLDVFTVAPGTATDALFLGIVFGFLSFAGFEAASTLGEETSHPRRDIPRAILGTAIFGGIFFVVVTAVEMMGFGSNAAGVKAFTSSGSLLGDLGSSYIGSWVGDLISLGATVSAFGCCLACTVGASRLLYAMNRDLGGEGRGLARLSSADTPARSAATVSSLMVLAFVVMIACGGKAEETFAWSATMGTLILLVAYVITTVGAIRLVFVQRKLPVPSWQVVIPVLAIVVLGYTIYRNVWPWPPSGAARVLPIVSGAWIVLSIVVVACFPRAAQRLGRRLAADEGFATESDAQPKRFADA
ncbi:MAG: APC family permease [Actinomycetota bacterium]|nr:APC family permease [Actinomycetota bacterium]